MKVSVIGLGFVGTSMYRSFIVKQIQTFGYDKYKESPNSFEDCLQGNIIFLALPTSYDENNCSYDMSSIIETCEMLQQRLYTGIVVIKSTVEPNTTQLLSKKFKNLKLVHNPEFLTASTAFEDFHNQKHIVLGKSQNIHNEDLETLQTFYQTHYSDAEISVCASIESESMKSFVNCFYAVKVQFFNELYSLCEKMNCDYNKVKDLMLKNNWIHPMHTQVPGPDWKLSYGGYCFPKDTNALLSYMKRENTHCKVLEATIEERNLMRNDHVNIKVKNAENDNSNVMEAKI